MSAADNPAVTPAGENGLSYASGPGRAGCCSLTVLGIRDRLHRRHRGRHRACPPSAATFGAEPGRTCSGWSPPTRSTLAGLLLFAGAAGRPVRPQADLPDRRHMVRAVLAAVRVRRRLGIPDCGPCPAGGRSRVADAGQPGHHRGVVPPRRSRQGDRSLVGAVRRGHRDRAVPGRMAGPGGVLAADLRDQPAGRGRDHRGGRAARTGVPGSGNDGQGRRDRRDLGHPRPDRGDLRADGGPRAAGPGHLRWPR